MNEFETCNDFGFPLPNTRGWPHLRAFSALRWDSTTEHPCFKADKLRTENRELRTETKKALRRFPGHRARFSHDDLFSYLVMNAALTLRSKPEIETEVRICLS